MVKDIINKEDIQEFVKEMNLFTNYNEDISVNYSMNKHEESSFVNHIANVSFDCVKVFKESKYEIYTLHRVNETLQKDFKVIKKYLLTNIFGYLDIRVSQNNLTKWKNSDLKKLREYVKQNHKYTVHNLQLKYKSDELYPTIKITFQRGCYSPKWKIETDIREYAYNVLGFSNQIRITW